MPHIPNPGTLLIHTVHVHLAACFNHKPMTTWMTCQLAMAKVVHGTGKALVQSTDAQNVRVAEYLCNTMSCFVCHTLCVLKRPCCRRGLLQQG